MPSFHLRIPLWPTTAAIAGIVLTIALGNWQLRRASEKAAMVERINSANRDAPIELARGEVDADAVAWHHVEARGRFEPKYAVLIDNRIVDGVVGYYVVMPLKISGSDRYALVNRGWIAATGSRSALPQIKTPDRDVRVTGLATLPSKRYLELSTRVTEGNVWQNLTIKRYRAAMPIAIQPVVIQQENDIDDGLKRVWSAPDLGIDRHYGYAFQWYAMAAAIVIIYLVCNVRKRA